MPSIWSALSSSSSSSGGKRPLKGKSKSSNDIFKKEGSNEQKRKLTRQRKLRHVTDDELGLKSSGIDDRSQSWPVSPDSGSGPGSGARTPHHAGGGGHWSKSAVPQPLPRPKLNYQLTQNDSPHGPRLGAGDPPGSAFTRFGGLTILNFNYNEIFDVHVSMILAIDFNYCFYLHKHPCVWIEF